MCTITKKHCITKLSVKSGMLMIILFIFSTVSMSYSAGLLIADGGFGGVLEIVEHDVSVTINNGIAVTKVTQIFRNTENRQVEALYTFPVPKGASVSNFSMWINGKEMVGEVLEKKRAREIYNSYKRKRRDPGLLEQVDYKTFEMRIFPIGPQARQKVEVTYYQELTVDNDQAVYVYPLATVTRKDIDAETKGKFSFSLETKSEIPIVSMESPSHSNELEIIKHTDKYYQASYETKKGNLQRDVVLRYALSRPVTGIDMLFSKEKNEDGFFLMMLTIGEELKKFNIGMDYIFVLDISGSMRDDNKLIISQNSIEAFLNELSEKDRLEIITFNVRPRTLFNQLQSVTAQTKTTASNFLSSQNARGGTALLPAVRTAYKYNDPERKLNVVILSDGLTDQKERRTLLRLIDEKQNNVRVFCIGVGNEVNKSLLEQVAEESGGLAAFISSGDDFKKQAKAFRRKLMHPVASDLNISFNGVSTYDIEPIKYPDMYHGTPLRIFGRYKKSGQTSVIFKANVNGKNIKQTVNIDFPKTDNSSPEIERMWAWHRIDRLQKEADKKGNRNAVIDEIVNLGEAFSIVSEYTSFLVLENNAEYRRWKIKRRNLVRLERDRRSQQALRSELNKIRSKSIETLGPGNPQPDNTPAPTKVSTPVRNTNHQIASRPVDTSTTRRRRRSGNFNFGSGPVGPLFMGLIFWFYRKKRNFNSSDKKEL